MQPIALDLELVRSVINEWGDYKVQREFHKMIENLERYHSVPVDQVDGKSSWFEGFKEIINRITDQNLQKMITDLLGPRNIKYFPARLNDNSKLLESLSDSTPDKIGLELKNHNEGVRKFYSINSFNSSEHPPECRLFRIPKTINIKPGYIFSDLSWLLPFIRNSRKIEFCDLFLFKNPKFDDDAEFVKLIIKSIPELSEVVIHCEPNPLNILQKQVQSELKKLARGKLNVEMRAFNPPTKGVNHDRFILVDTNKISIRFTTSFNNLRKTKEGKFRAQDAFLIEISNGRKYYD
ncbi:MAG: hypothetical protein HUU54_08470 [Ignavibacteriaceae bacterium]|nr:hypothetical protein [Ignavibacteriaceae bacterium]